MNFRSIVAFNAATSALDWASWAAAVSNSALLIVFLEISSAVRSLWIFASAARASSEASWATSTVVSISKSKSPALTEVPFSAATRTMMPSASAAIVTPSTGARVPMMPMTGCHATAFAS